MPDLISRYLSQVLTIDQIETLTNKTIGGDLNTFSSIPNSALVQITDKAKLPSDVVYAGTPYTQSLLHHSNVQVDGLLDGQVLKWNESLQKWINVTPTTEVSGVSNAANLSGEGATIFSGLVGTVLNFNRIRSMSSVLSITNVGNEVQFTIPDSSTTLKGVVQLNDDGGTNAGMAIHGGDSRLTNARNPNAHATNHKTGGTDSIKLDELASPTDITTLNATNSAHGLLPKLSGNSSHVLLGDGTFGAPPSVSSAYKVKHVTEYLYESSSTLATMVSYAFAGGEMGTDKIYEIVVDGLYKNDSGADRELEIKISFGASVLFDQTAGLFSDAGSVYRVLNLRLLFYNRGVNNAQEITGWMEMSLDTPVGATGYGDITQNNNLVYSPMGGVSAVDTSVANTLKVEFRHSASSAELEFHRRLAYIKEV